MMGHHDVFTHVGDQVKVQAPGGKPVAPLVTGMFVPLLLGRIYSKPVKVHSDLATSYTVCLEVRLWCRDD